MPPRSYYLDPQIRDYRALLESTGSNQLENFAVFARDFALPYIESERELAGYLGVSHNVIRQILHQPGFHYRVFTIPKRDGTKRWVHAPKTYLKVIQWWILDNILSNTEVHDAAHGFRKERNYCTNACAHLGANHILNVDIENFFPSITFEMIKAVFEELGYSVNAASLLARLCSLKNEAPTGAPTSPAIGNLVLRGLDQELLQEAARRDLVYTRYADDLTFSSTEGPIHRAFLRTVKSKLNKYGFSINDRKTRLLGRGDSMEVTGLVINNGINLPRKWRNRVRGLLHRATLNPNDYINQFDEIAGIFGTLKALDPESQRRLTRKAVQALAAIRPHLPERRPQ